ncbi:MAG: hypothetical protein ABIR37_03140 [Candidatus Saccharimonadales bacterium]
MSGKIKIEQEFRASYRLNKKEAARIALAGIKLSESAEEITEDGRQECNRNSEYDESTCELKFKYNGVKKIVMSYGCAKNLGYQPRCADKTMPTGCMQRLLESLQPHVDSIEDIPPDFI